MEKIKAFALKNRWYFIAALIALVVTIVYFKYKFQHDLNKTIAYINSNPEAASWRELIQEKAISNNTTYDLQLLADAKYTVKQQNKGNPFLFLL